MTHAIRVGTRYVRHSPRLRAVLARTLAFCAFSSALWALLPVVAHDRLGMGSGGYGLLLAAVGVGAVAGAFALPAARVRAGRPTSSSAPRRWRSPRPRSCWRWSRSVPLVAARAGRLAGSPGSRC